MTRDLAETVLEANVLVHTRMAASYAAEEPHFRPENRKKVSERLKRLVGDKRDARMLDLGCGTGFMIRIGAEMCGEVLGVDATPAMLEEVDRSGPAEITLICGDTARVELPRSHFDIATSYSFLHHLSDIRPTLANAARSLKHNGALYVDLEPNYYFWEAVHSLSESEVYSPAIERELLNVRHKDLDVQTRFGIAADTFNHAEYFKNIRGGFREEELRVIVLESGFAGAEFFYHWFVGEALLLNSPGTDRNVQVEKCGAINQALQDGLPLSRNLFKYLGFVAIK
jgi:ubiquinone/menaquinone biosynthesis C-methylase UbiE